MAKDKQWGQHGLVRRRSHSFPPRRCQRERSADKKIATHARQGHSRYSRFSEKFHRE